MDELLELMDGNDAIGDDNPFLSDDDDGDDEEEEEDVVVERDATIPRRRSSSIATKTTDGAQPSPSSRRTTRLAPSTRPTAQVSHQKRDHNNNKNNNDDNTNGQQPQRPVRASIDDRLGIRMINRLISSVDLQELVEENAYFAPATLSAMPLSRLNTLLQDPARIVDAATVAGNTNLLTVGIVFQNSGTRISQKGGSAFCVLSVGSLSSGPCVSVFLFGDAYGKYMKACTKGKVICLLSPKLLPARDNSNNGGGGRGSNSANDHAISFSVHNLQQLRMVGTARDYGTCKASNVRVKQRDGSWANNGQCPHFVDKRVSEYCQFHARKSQQHGQSAQQKGPIKKVPLVMKSSKFQQLRQQPTQTRAPPPVLASQTGRHVPQQPPNKGSSNRFLTAAPKTNAVPRTMEPNRMIRDEKSKLHKRGGTLPPSTSMKGTSTNPFLHNQSSMVARTHPQQPVTQDRNTPQKRKEPPKSTVPNSGGGDWLQQGMAQKQVKRPKSLSQDAKRAAKAAKKPVLINNGGFDGSVPVPRPSKIFTSVPPSSQPPITTTAGATTRVTPSSELKVVRKKQHDVLKQQTEIAQKMKQMGGGISVPEKRFRKKARQTQPSDTGNAFLDAMGGPVDEESVRNAKSRFCDEIQAEEYAKSRQKVSELEKLEAAQDARDKKLKRNKDPDKPQLQKWWLCKTCGQCFSLRPRACIVANHEIKMRREIVGAKSKTEERLGLHCLQVGDGGLQLGSGLEWSMQHGRVGWSRFS